MFYKAFQKWGTDKAATLAAALALYTGMSLAPLLILIVALAGLILNGDEVQQSILIQVDAALGQSGVDVVAAILEGAFDPTAGLIASILSLASFMWSASSLFAQLQDAMNTIWQVPAQDLSGVWAYIVARGKAVVMVIFIGLLLIFTVLLTTIIQAFQALLQSPEFVARVPFVSGAQYRQLIDMVLPITDIIVSILVLTIVFAWVFRFVPHVKVTWRDVMPGAILTAILFYIGKFGLAIYLTNGSVGSAYGAAGALLVLLVWVYYSGQILFYGTEFTYVWAHTFGSMKDVGGTAEVE
ncbi:MAG: YihY/virulence factor BrkB family protein [Candidatus Promineifilaceae bacterium]